MALAHKITDKALIPAGLEKEYVERDGAYFLDVTGVVPAERIAEFRDNNVALIKERDGLKAQLAGVDLAKYEELKAMETNLREGKIKDTPAAKLLEERTGAMKTEYEGKLSQADVKTKKLEAELARVAIDSALVAEALKQGLDPRATADLISRGRATWQLVDGVATAMDKDGKPRYNATASALTFTDYVGELIKDAPHLFKPNEGGGADPGKGANQNPGTQANPWDPKTLNYTAQGAMIKRDRALAARMAKQHGINI